MAFLFEALQLPDIIRVTTHVAADPRGHFMQIYQRSAFVAHGIAAEFVQDNLSHSARGVLRGLHYQQPPQAQGKLVIPLRGTIFDVAVDIRPDSATYRQWAGEILRADSGQMLYIPPGFAHSFCVLSDAADVCYKVTAEYAPALERGVRWDDPTISITWPLDAPILSAKDAQLPLLDAAEPYGQGQPGNAPRA